MYKQFLMWRYLETQTKVHKLTQQQIPKHMNFPDSTHKQCRIDIKMDRPYKKMIPKAKKKRLKTFSDLKAS